MRNCWGGALAIDSASDPRARPPLFHRADDGLDNKILINKGFRDFVCAPCAVTNISAVDKRCVASRPRSR